MKKLYLLALILFSFILWSCSTQDHEKHENIPEEPTTVRSIEDAERELMEIVSTGFATRSGGARAVSERHRLGGTPASRCESGQDEPVIYLFNFADEDGFALMSSDIRTPSLLALVEKGNLDPEEELDNPGLAIAMGCMESYMIAAASGKDPNMKDREPGTDWRTGGSTWKTTYGTWEKQIYCEPKSRTDWHQNSPYNIFCPTINGSLPKAGCTAIACAQLMAVYSYPSYYFPVSFDWPNILSIPSYDGMGTFDSRIQQIATLVNMLGFKENLDMDYGLEDSGASSSKIPRTLLNFGYSSGGKLKTYNSAEVINELTNGYVCILRGNAFRKDHKVLGITVSTTYHDGHAWLAHGAASLKSTITSTHRTTGATSIETESKQYINCNMGWSSTGTNGYYLAGIFDTNNMGDEDSKILSVRSDMSGQKGNYQYNVEMITGIRK